MGITTQHCIGGQSIMSFGEEPKPNGIAQPAGCDDRGPGGPGVPAGVDDGVGSCAGERTEIQDDVALFSCSRRCARTDHVQLPRAGVSDRAPA
ncbi:MAG: hypothetical protein IAG13_24710 [Deltaproteobacteria bacterium]|nr:hypothetical protein [Nannocystaceae bacterium]